MPAVAGRGLLINQFAIKGAKYSRRPDIILFLNGLPLVLLELKNPADENADIWKAFDQLQTYKEQIPDVFEYNEVLVISDGTEARMGSLSADTERFMAWRTIDGVTIVRWGSLMNWKRWCVGYWLRFICWISCVILCCLKMTAR